MTVQKSLQGIEGPLTERQQRVLRGVFDGLTNKEIASAVGVSEGAVKATLQQLFRRARVRNRVQLVRIVIEGSLEVPRPTSIARFERPE